MRGPLRLCVTLTVCLPALASCRPSPTSPTAPAAPSPVATGLPTAPGPCLRTEWDADVDTPARVVRYRYDRAGRLVSEDEDFEELCFVEGGYENEGCMEVAREADGKFDRRTDYAYDRDGRLVRIREHDHPRGGYVVSTKFRHDEAGRVVEKVWQNVTTRYTYEGDRRVREAATSDGDERPHLLVEHAYDADGRRVRTVERWPDSNFEVVTVSRYDARGRLAEQTTQDSRDAKRDVVTFGYDDRDREVVRTQRHGEYVAQMVRTEYDANGRPRAERTFEYGDVATRVEWRYECGAR